MNYENWSPRDEIEKNATRFKLRLAEDQKALGAEQATSQIKAAGLGRYMGQTAEIEPLSPCTYKIADPSGILTGATNADPVSYTELTAAQEKLGPFIEIFPADPQPSGKMTVALKDVFAFEDHHPTAGLAHAPRELSLGKTEIISRLKSAGANIVGTTKCSPWCYVPSEQNEFVAPPINPLGADLLVGGSSSGAAVATAAGLVTAAIGTDTGGSVRIPAALCGLYGYKSSPNCIAKTGGVPLGGLQDTVGILTRTAQDLSKVFDVIATDCDNTVMERKIGLPDQIFDLADREISEARNLLSAKFGKIGIPVDRCASIDLDLINAIAGIITGHFAGRYHGARMNEYPDEYPQSIIGRLCTGLSFSDDVQQAALIARQIILNDVMETTFADCSFVIAPTVNRYAQKAPLPWSEQPPELTSALNIELLSMNRWVNLLGLPAVTVPIDIGRSIPAAIQIVGKPNTDSDLIDLVYQLV